MIGIFVTQNVNNMIHICKEKGLEPREIRLDKDSFEHFRQHMAPENDPTHFIDYKGISVRPCGGCNGFVLKVLTK